MSNCAQCVIGYEAGDRYCTQCGRPLSSFQGGDEMVTQKALDLSDVRYRLAMVYFKQGVYARAVEIFQKILEERPGDQELERLIEDARSRASEG